MSGEVVLYCEDQADALRFALAAGSVMAAMMGTRAKIWFTKPPASAASGWTHPTHTG